MSAALAEDRRTDAAPGEATPVLALENVSRAFGPVQVLFDLDFDLRAGEVHALIGENGAGKSTTMKILAGYLAASEGRILLDGRPVTFASGEAAEDSGVVMIHQEFNLAPQLTVEQNIFLGRELKRGWRLDHKRMRATTLELLAALETHIDPRATVADISVPEKQMVEIAKALSRDARVLIMDEPTASLTSREAEILFRQVERLRAKGTAILFTSHKLDEVKRIADQVTVLRDGKRVLTAPAEELTENAMAEAMVGRELSDLFPPKTPADDGDTVLRVSDLTVGDDVRGVSFDLRRGEILGFAGLVGSGRTEVMEGLIGARQASGRIEVNGAPVQIRSVEDARAAGIAYLTEDRKERGLLLNQSMRQNLTLLALPKFTNVLIDGRAEEAALDRSIEEFDIRAPTRNMLVGNLSGGNQQKLLLAKIMLADPQIVIIDEPTRGIDIGTKQQIYHFIHRLADAGKSVIVISSEMTEVIGIADRVVVMRQGRVAGELSGADVNEDKIVRLAMGLDRGDRDNG
ncbi:sugar ABC transporter ATP-binding protein [Psychromarinibacter sp. C21-152]|uniref:Sugar ABC transporter ATP-binding protein n=1 Tax=Psychromarinibacter sediminicola TaxID=3033385 RepID=A0AAE3T991_9RHOB|nr:sugar ABC transporter ATP-binding protein [Psychromarinibacter sediminicola]MDF0601957.1 sugar ABC transporter ATP-binding protein [Psychromarinibacter sediminicola]